MSFICCVITICKVARFKKVKIVRDKRTEKSRGYAFIEFEHKRDMNAAYKEADGMKVDGKRI